MTNLNDSPLWNILRDLVSTVNGVVRLIGAALIGLPVYWIFTHPDLPPHIFWFGVGVIGLGVVWVAVSVLMAVKARSEAGKMEVRRLDADARKARMEHGEPDRTIYRVDD